MNKADKDKVIDALSMNRVMAADAEGNYTREVTPKAITEALTIMRGLAEDAEPQNNEALWLWKNGDHMLAYRHLYPCYPGGDPMVLGEPVAKAYFRQSFDRGGTSPQAAQTEARNVTPQEDAILRKAARRGATIIDRDASLYFSDEAQEREALDGALSDDKPYIAECKGSATAIRTYLENKA